MVKKINPSPDSKGDTWSGSYILDPSVLQPKGTTTSPVYAEGITPHVTYVTTESGDSLPITYFYDSGNNLAGVSYGEDQITKYDNGNYVGNFTGQDALKQSGILTGYKETPDYSNITTTSLFSKTDVDGATAPFDPNWNPTQTKPNPDLAWLYGKENLEGSGPAKQLHDALWKAYDSKIQQNPDLAGKIYNPDALAYTQWKNNGANGNALPDYEWNINETTLQFLNAMNNNVAQTLGSPPPTDLTTIPQNEAYLNAGLSAAEAAFAHDQTTNSGGLGDLGILGIVAAMALAAYTGGASMAFLGGETAASAGLAAADALAAGMGYVGAADAVAAGILPEALGMAAGVSAAEVTAASAAATLTSAGIATTAAELIPAATAVIEAGGGVAALVSAAPNLIASGGLETSALSGAATGASPFTSIGNAISSAQASFYQPLMQVLADAGIDYSIYSQVPTVLTPMIKSAILGGDPISSGASGLLSGLGIPPAIANAAIATISGQDPTNALISGVAGLANSAGVPGSVTNSIATLVKTGDIGAAINAGLVSAASTVARDAGVPDAVINATTALASGVDPSTAILNGILSAKGSPTPKVDASGSPDDGPVVSSGDIDETGGTVVEGNGTSPLPTTEEPPITFPVDESAPFVEPDRPKIEVIQNPTRDDTHRGDDIPGGGYKELFRYNHPDGGYTVRSNDGFFYDFNSNGELSGVSPDESGGPRPDPVVNPVDEPLVEVVPPVVNPVDEPLVEVVPPVVNPVDEPLVEVVPPVVNPVDEPLVEVVPPVVDPVDEPLVEVVPPVVDPVDEPLVEVVPPVFEPNDDPYPLPEVPFPLPGPTISTKIDGPEEVEFGPRTYLPGYPLNLIPNEDPYPFPEVVPEVFEPNDDPYPLPEVPFPLPGPTISTKIDGPEEVEFGPRTYLPGYPLNLIPNEDPYPFPEVVPEVFEPNDDPYPLPEIVPNPDDEFPTPEILPNPDDEFPTPKIVPNPDDEFPTPKIVPNPDDEFPTPKIDTPGPVIKTPVTKPVITQPKPVPTAPPVEAKQTTAPAAEVIDSSIPGYKDIGLRTTGGETKFESVLSPFQQLVKEDFYSAKPYQQNKQQTQQAVPVRSDLNQQSRQQGGSDYFNYGKQSDIEQMLGNDPGTQMLYSKAGGLATPLFAGGGTTRYGRYVGGGLPMVEHSGKARIDFRTGNAVTGPGDGQSDDIPAMLADGEFVFPADVVAALGNGSTKAGSDKLYDMMHSIRAYHRSAKPEDLPPEAKKSPLDYLTKTARKGRR